MLPKDSLCLGTRERDASAAPPIMLPKDSLCLGTRERDASAAAWALPPRHSVPKRQRACPTSRMSLSAGLGFSACHAANEWGGGRPGG